MQTLTGTVLLEMVRKILPVEAEVWCAYVAKLDAFLFISPGSDPSTIAINSK